MMNHDHRARRASSAITERCAICGCLLHRTKGTYATTEGRAHASKHHFVAERFFGRSANRPGAQRTQVFETCPWSHECETGVFCYECHELLMHNPVMLPEDIRRFSELVRRRGLSEGDVKSETFEKIGKRIMLFREVISQGLATLLEEK